MQPYYSQSGITIFNGDCLEIMPTLDPGSIDAIICDPPYGTTACTWDTVIPFAPMWVQIKRMVKPRAAVVLFGSQPFTSALVMSNPKWFKYEWVWDKVNLYTNTLNANRQPLKRHENIVVFADGQTTYNKQFRTGAKYSRERKNQPVATHLGASRSQYKQVPTINMGDHNPCSVLEIKGDIKAEKGYHPTQKPLDLLRYLILTYTNPGDTVLDFTMGSGTTLVVAKQLGRKAIGIELDERYVNIAIDRLQQEVLAL